MKLNKNIAVSESGFIFKPTTGDSFSSNTIGAAIIEMLKADKKAKEITKAICEKYEVDASSFEKDLEDFMLQLRDSNLTSNEG